MNGALWLVHCSTEGINTQPIMFTADFAGTNPPMNCEPGYYCPSQTPAPNRYPCPAGYYSPSANLTRAEECTICPAGEYCLGKNTYNLSNNIPISSIFPQAAWRQRVGCVRPDTTAHKVLDLPQSTPAPMELTMTIMALEQNRTAKTALKVITARRHSLRRLSVLQGRTCLTVLLRLRPPPILMPRFKLVQVWDNTLKS
jgi:hypothetical protein